MIKVKDNLLALIFRIKFYIFKCLNPLICLNMNKIEKYNKSETSTNLHNLQNKVTAIIGFQLFTRLKF
jgi:hypothetical protein